jgi:hypothetical protein
MEYAANPIVGIDGHGAFFHDDRVTADGAGNFSHYGFYVREVGGAGIALRSAHGDEDGLALLDGTGEIAGELDPAIEMFGKQLGQVLLEDGNATFAESFDPGFVIIHANDAMADLGKANCRDKADVSRPDYADGNWL